MYLQIFDVSNDVTMASFLLYVHIFCLGSVVKWRHVLGDGICPGVLVVRAAVGVDGAAPGAQRGHAAARELVWGLTMFV